LGLPDSDQIHCDTAGCGAREKENPAVELPYELTFDVPGNPLEPSTRMAQTALPEMRRGCAGARRIRMDKPSVDSSCIYMQRLKNRAGVLIRRRSMNERHLFG